MTHAAVGLGDFALQHNCRGASEVLGVRVEGVNVTPHPQDTHLFMGELQDHAHAGRACLARAGIGSTPSRALGDKLFGQPEGEDTCQSRAIGIEDPEEVPCSERRWSSHSASIDRASSDDEGTLSRPLTNSTSEAASASKSTSSATS